MRTIPALLLTGGLLVGLTACAGGPFAQDCVPAPSGKASAYITATGTLGTKPSVDFPTPAITNGVDVTTLIDGDGEKVHFGQTVALQFTVANGATGATLGQSNYSGEPQLLTLGASTTAEVFTEGLECTTVGSRVALVGSAEETHGGQADPQNGIGKDDSFVYVIDIIDAYPAKASGADQLPIAGLPAVVRAPSGAPGITIPRQDPPADLSVAPLIVGDGATVDEGATVLVKYTAVLWSDGGVFDSTWSKNQAVLVSLTDQSSVPEGVVSGITGQKVGSQVLIVVPPANGYGDEGTTGVPPGSTLVYVVDILGIHS